MTISSTNSRMSYTGNGSTNTYSFTYKINDEADLLVTVRHPTTGAETTLTITTDYTVTINANGTGSITLVNASQAWLTAGNLTTSWKLSIRRVVDLIQETDIRNQGEFFPEVHEDAFDYQVMISQQLKDEIDRSVKVPETESGAFYLPSIAERAGNLLGFDSNGEPIATDAASGASLVSSAGQVVVQEDVLSINSNAYIATGIINPMSVATDAPAGSLYLNYSTGVVYRKTDAGSSTNWLQLSTVTGTETLTNKTVDVLTFDDQGSTPSNPAAGFYKFYVKSDGKFYRLNSAGLEQVASGGPSLGTNSIIRTNAQTISEDITFAGTENGSTVGPVTIANTYTVTVTSGSNWVII